MVANNEAADIEPSVLPQTWDNPEICPFCRTELENGGAGFIDHIETSRTCKAGFDRWRGQVADDIKGGWIG